MILIPRTMLKIFVSVAVLSVVSVIATVAHAADGQALYQQTLAKYRTLTSYTATIKSNTILQPIDGSTPNTVQSTMSVQFKKPNFLHVNEEGLMGGGTMVSDGKTMWGYSALTNEYGSHPAPKDLLGVALGGIRDMSGLHNAGQQVIDGKPTTHLAGNLSSRAGPTTVDVFVDNSTKLLRRVVVHVPHLPGAQGASFRMTVTYDYLAQALNTSVPSKLFKFLPPAGAEKAASGSLPALTGSPSSMEP